MSRCVGLFQAGDTPALPIVFTRREVGPRCVGPANRASDVSQGRAQRGPTTGGFSRRVLGFPPRKSPSHIAACGMTRFPLNLNPCW